MSYIDECHWPPPCRTGTSNERERVNHCEKTLWGVFLPPQSFIFLWKVAPVACLSCYSILCFSRCHSHFSFSHDLWSPWALRQSDPSAQIVSWTVYGVICRPKVGRVSGYQATCQCQVCGFSRLEIGMSLLMLLDVHQISLGIHYVNMTNFLVTRWRCHVRLLPWLETTEVKLNVCGWHRFQNQNKTWCTGLNVYGGLYFFHLKFPYLNLFSVKCP